MEEVEVFGWRDMGAPPSALRTIAANLRNTPLRLRLQIKQRIPPRPPAAAAAAVAVSDDVSLVFLPFPPPFPPKELVKWASDCGGGGEKRLGLRQYNKEEEGRGHIIN